MDKRTNEQTGAGQKLIKKAQHELTNLTFLHTCLQKNIIHLKIFQTFNIFVKDERTFHIILKQIIKFREQLVQRENINSFQYMRFKSTHFVYLTHCFLIL